MFPGDSLLLSAGGNQLRVWDILGGSSGRLLHQSANHQKTITSMCFDGDYTRVLTGSLDQHVKIYDVSDYHVTHSVKYPSPILSIGLSPDNTHLVAGMVNGLLSIRQRQSSSIMMTGGDQQQVVQDERLLTGTAAPVASSGATDSPVYLTRHEKEMRLNGGSYRFFMRGQHKMPSSDDYVVRNESKKPKLKAFEKCLKNFQYSLALDTALQTNMPTITIITLLEELNNRGDGLRIALSSRDDVSLEPILNFIMRNISYPRYVEILGKVLDMIIGK
jgi:U3 small nucleolar RNA-associated protein 15